MGMILLCAGTILCGGCATYRAIPLEGDDPAHARAFRKEVDGVVIAAQLVSGEAEIQAYFYRRLNEKGIVPVVVHIENLGGAIDQVLDQRIQFGCFPWRFVGGEAAMCRAVAFLDYSND